MCGADDRLEAGSAQAVDGLPRHLDREAGEERGHAADVAVVLTRLVRCPEDHVVDHAGIDTGSLHHRTNDVRGQIVRPDVLQRAAVAAERRAQAVHDHGCSGGIAIHRHDASALVVGRTIDGPRESHAGVGRCPTPGDGGRAQCAG